MCSVGHFLILLKVTWTYLRPLNTLCRGEDIWINYPQPKPTLVILPYWLSKWLTFWHWFTSKCKTMVCTTGLWSGGKTGFETGLPWLSTWWFAVATKPISHSLRHFNGHKVGKKLETNPLQRLLLAFLWMAYPSFSLCASSFLSQLQAVVLPTFVTYFWSIKWNSTILFLPTSGFRGGLGVGLSSR